MATVKVRKGVELPHWGTNGRRTFYPWRTMEVGDSFIFPEGYARQHADKAASLAGKKHNRKFSVRALHDGRIGCWRVS